MIAGLSLTRTHSVINVRQQKPAIILKLQRVCRLQAVGNRFKLQLFNLIVNNSLTPGLYLWSTKYQTRYVCSKHHHFKQQNGHWEHPRQTTQQPAVSFLFGQLKDLMLISYSWGHLKKNRSSRDLMVPLFQCTILMWKRVIVQPKLVLWKVTWTRNILLYMTVYGPKQSNNIIIENFMSSFIAW